MTKPRISPLTTLAGAGIAVAVMAGGSMWLGASPRTVDGTAQSAHPSQVRLACPAGIIDPFETSNVAPGTTWTSLTSTPTSLAPASVTGNGGTIPTALTLVGQGGGELAGLSAVGCAVPRTSQWIATGATLSGADMVLMLSNPGPTASVVSIDGYGASGPLNAASRQVTVPATSSVSVLLAGWFPDENALAVRVRADGGGVAAWVQASLMNGEVPQGATLASAVVPATSQTILGIDPKGTSLLRMVSPSGEAHVSVSVADSTGVHPLPGGQATVAEGTTLDMPLDGASSDSLPIALIVTSDREVVAQTTTITLGAPWAQRASAWIMRSNASPATALTDATIPGASQLSAMTTSVLSSTPLRATSVATDSGVNASSASLLLYAPADAAGAATASQGDTAQSAQPGPSATPDIWASPSPVTSQSGASQSGQSRDAQSSGTSASTPGAVPVRVGDRTIYVAPGVPTLVNLPDSASHISADTPIQAALVITADTAVGRMSTTWNVGTEGISAVTGAIRTAN